jgi:hypothetical protein
MEGNFASRYEQMLDSFTNENDRNDYILKCTPYIQKYFSNEETTEYDKSFNMFITKGVQKSDVYQEYLEHVETTVLPGASKKNHLKTDIYMCSRCKSSNVYIDSNVNDIVCHDCANAEPWLSEELTYREEQEQSEMIIVYSYKRDNHFNEWLLQFQAQEQTNIPDQVIEKLRTEFKKTKIKSLDEITHARVRAFLKKLKLNKYYEHVPYIANILNGIQPPKMSLGLEERLRRMFQDIQEPFNKHCPENRKNFLSYSYVLYKFCELLCEDDYLDCFPLLKSKEKLYQQDVIWRNICKELKWEFIPTI